MLCIKKLSLSLLVASISFAGCSSNVKTVDLSSIEGANVDDLYIVDCLLPASVRQLGTKLTYLGARRAVKVSGSECAIRGGEYVAYDRANFQTALKAWLPLAEAGDAKAQTYVGEIYEKGLGTAPNYAQAVNWYQRAANKGFARAKMSLGSLYERGLGVPRNNVQALALYRDASGLTDKQVEFVTPAQLAARAAQRKQLIQTQRELQAAQGRTSQLQRDVQQLQAEAKRLKSIPPKVIEKTRVVTVNDPEQAKIIDQLRRAVTDLRKKAQQTQKQIVLVPVNTPDTASQAKARALQAKNAKLRKQLQQQQSQLAEKEAELKRSSTPKTVANRAPVSVSKVEQKKQIAVIEEKIKLKEKELRAEEEKVSKLALRSAGDSKGKASNLKGVSFGRYYALVIGNNSYSNLPTLKTAVNDAKTIASVLKNDYGFRTAVLSNASRGKMLASLNKFVKQLKPSDNLVLYYAGHGQLNGGRGFWLPTDAKNGDQKSWISNEQITNFIDAMAAKHVMVVADSCYSGTLSQNSIPRPVGSSSKDRAWFDAVSNTKVRVVMSSGGVKPVLDSGGGNHSVFASAFLSALRSGTPVMEGAGLFQAIRPNVVSSSKAVGKPQSPQYAPIKFAGHEAGDFIFLKNGRIAQLGDNETPGNDDDEPQRNFWALREILLLITKV